MKKLILLLTFAIAGICAQAQATLIASLPPSAPTTTQLRAPNGLSTMTSLRAHFIIPASEITTIPTGTQLNDFAFVLTGGTDIPAGGTITLYLENTSDATNLKSTTWSTAIGTMTSVYNGAFNLHTGTTTPAILKLSLSAPFTYTGGGLYIAYDYLGTTFSTLPATYAANSDLAASTYTGTSSTTTPPSMVSATSAFRPQIQLSYPNPYNNEVVVVDVEMGKGHESKLLNTGDSVTAIIKNASNTTLTNIPVTLTITGSNATVQNQNIASLGAGLSDTITFSGLSTANSGTQEIKVSVPPDQVTSDDSIVLNQVISCDTLGYGNNSAPFDGIGFGTGSGILAARFQAPSAFPLSVKGVNVVISTGTANVGNQVYGVILNNQGQILATTAPVMLAGTDLGQKLTFNFDEPVPVDIDSVFYVGLAQIASGGIGYYPVGTQYPQTIPDNRTFSFLIAGGGRTMYNDLGNLMIEALISGHVGLSSNASNDTLCEATPVTYTATAGYTSYDFQVNGTSIQNTAAHTFDMPLGTTSAVQAFAMYNTCASASSADTLTAISIKMVSINITESENDICAGTEVTYSSMVNNPGTAPIYQWKVNGTDVGTDTSYTYTPADGDMISAYLISDVECASVDTAFSNEVTMNVDPMLVPSVMISANPGTTLNMNQGVTFTATPTNGGTAPQYQWRKNGADISGETSSTYIAIAGVDVQDNDQITVLLKSSEACADPDSANSNILTLDVSGSTGINGVAGQLDMKLYPNPGNGDITLTGKWHTATDKAVSVSVFNTVGQQVYAETISVNSSMQTYSLKLAGQLPPGTYMLKVSGEQSATMKFVVLER